MREDSVVRSAPDGATVQPACFDSHCGLTNAQHLSLTGLLIHMSDDDYCCCRGYSEMKAGIVPKLLGSYGD